MKKNKLLDIAVDFIVEKGRWIEIFFALLVVISIICAPMVKVNYDLSEYLPAWAPSKQGLNLMEKEFGYPGVARIMVGPCSSVYEAKTYKDLIANVDGVDMVMWADTASNIYAPESYLRESDLKDYYHDGYAVMDVTFTEGDSADSTHDALDTIKQITGDKGYFTGSAVQNKSLNETLTREIAIAMAMGVVMIYLVLTVTTTSWFEPVLFLLIMGIAIIINMGSNIVMGTISFLTFSVAAILQLAIAMDYSIFLLDTFTEERKQGFEPKEAMANAIKISVSSILASGATTIVGFFVLALMRFSIGRDMGLVLAKGIVVSLLTVLLLMPALILRWSDKIQRLHHRSFMPSFQPLGRFIYRIRYVLLGVAAVLVIPCYAAQNMNSFLFGNDALGSSPGTQVYEDEKNINSRFGRSNLMLALVPNEGMVTEKMLSDELSDLSYVKNVVSLAGSLPEGIPDSFLPGSVTGMLHTENYARMLITVKTASESELSYRCSDEIQSIIKKYYPEDSYLVGVTPATQDIEDILYTDYNFVNILSLLGVALVVMITFRSPLIPIVVMIPIEVAIFINMTLPYIYGSKMIFMGYIIVSCLQLGATIDYSILVTNHYLDNRVRQNKKEAAMNAVSQSALSVLTSGSILTIVGYGLFFTSSVAAIGDIGHLVGRGALLSLTLVLGLLPALLILFDRAIFNQKKRLRRMERILRVHRMRRIRHMRQKVREISRTREQINARLKKLADGKRGRIILPGGAIRYRRLKRPDELKQLPDKPEREKETAGVSGAPRNDTNEEENHENER